MKSQIILAVAGAASASPQFGGLFGGSNPLSSLFGGAGGCTMPKCQTIAQILAGPQQDAMTPLSPDVAQFPCDMGTKIPMGKVPSGCADLEILVARGTSEPGNLGSVVGDPLVARVIRDLPGVKVRGYPVQYNADMFGAGIGVADIRSRLAKESAECPNQKYVIAGYSQGGMVTQMAVSSIPADIAPKVIAVVLYGAGDGNVISSTFKQKTLANCAPGDFACIGSGSATNTGKYCTVGHISYNLVGTKWHDRASQYIVSAYKGSPQGFKTERTPV